MATSYSSDAMVPLFRVQDCAGAVSSNMYDAVGRLTSQTDPNAITTHYLYDPAGRRVLTPGRTLITS